MMLTKLVWFDHLMRRRKKEAKPGERGSSMHLKKMFLVIASLNLSL